MYFNFKYRVDKLTSDRISTPLSNNISNARNICLLFMDITSPSNIVLLKFSLILIIEGTDLSLIEFNELVALFNLFKILLLILLISFRFSKLELHKFNIGDKVRVFKKRQLLEMEAEDFSPQEIGIF